MDSCLDSCMRCEMQGLLERCQDWLVTYNVGGHPNICALRPKTEMLLAKELKELYRVCNVRGKEISVKVLHSGPPAASFGSKLLTGKAVLIMTTPYFMRYGQSGTLELDRYTLDLDALFGFRGSTQGRWGRQFELKEQALLQEYEKFAIAHELGHIFHEHWLKRGMFSIASSGICLGMLCILRKRGIPAGKSVSIMGSLVLGFSFAGKKLSRMQEAEADIFAAQAGFSNGGLEYFYSVNFQRRTKKQWLPVCFHTHPPLEERINMLLKFESSV
eukprot:Nk52_evm39s207 gene=Nk52_evmTU39s207